MVAAQNAFESPTSVASTLNFEADADTFPFLPVPFPVTKAPARWSQGGAAEQQASETPDVLTAPPPSPCSLTPSKTQSNKIAEARERARQLQGRERRHDHEQALQSCWGDLEAAVEAAARQMEGTNALVVLEAAAQQMEQDDAQQELEAEDKERGSKRRLSRLLSSRGFTGSGSLLMRSMSLQRSLAART